MPAIERKKPPPPNVAPSTRITVAFPFSSVKVHETDDRVRELAAVVAELADRLAALEPGPAGEKLQARAHELVTELAS